MIKEWRKSGQHLLPEEKPFCSEGKYDIYPSFKLEANQIASGFDPLADIISKHNIIVIDGYIGVFYNMFREKLNKLLSDKGLTISWTLSSEFLKDPDVITEMISPFTGGDDPIFGYRTTLNLADFFHLPRLNAITPDQNADISIIIGPGAALSKWNGLLIYTDLPKNELQYRSRAGAVSNLGASFPGSAEEMYKRFYFVDWIVLNKHKKEILKRIDLFIDAQRPGQPESIGGNILRHSLTIMSRNSFRLRPWFEPGVWGGNWIKNHIEGLNKEVTNYAWSFELIVPENGLLFESSGKLLEVSFDWLMYHDAQAILGRNYSVFGTEFPIRFDFLDTFDGGNLSIQCHPRPGYMKSNFGENFTQEETYYILDTKDNADVYLGFQDDIDPEVFRHELEESHSHIKPVKIEKFVRKYQARKHDLYLIPYGTIHGSGKNNLVLEISSTPYIFTFKIYDWLRPDLSGRLRPLNISRAMDNLFFDRKGRYVDEKLISQPSIIAEAEDWKIYRLPTHETHLYDVERLHFKTIIDVNTENNCHVLSLVEGTAIEVITGEGTVQQFSYAETFVIPAAAGSYRIRNKSDKEAIVIKAFVK